MSRTHALLLLVVAGSLGLAAHAQDTRKDPIEQRLDSCLAQEANFTTAGMQDCVGVAIDAWETALNKAHNDLAALLSPAGREALSRSQHAWTAYKEADQAQIVQFDYEEMQGTMYRAEAAMRIKELVMQRAMELRSMISTITHD